jgi:hypothetical protein
LESLRVCRNNNIAHVSRHIFFIDDPKSKVLGLNIAQEIIEGYFIAWILVPTDKLGSKFAHIRHVDSLLLGKHGSI